MDINLTDIRFHDHGSWKPDDGFTYHYFSDLRQSYLLVTSIDGYGKEIHVFYDNGYSTLIIPDLPNHKHTMLFRKDEESAASYDRYGVLLIDGKRLS